MAGYRFEHLYKAALRFGAGQLCCCIFCGAIVLGVAACSDDDKGDPCKSVRFSEDIAPIVASSCTGSSCHQPGAPIGDFSTYEGLKEKAETGALYLRVVELRLMPPQDSLSASELEAFKCWLEAGYPDN